LVTGEEIAESDEVEDDGCIAEEAEAEEVGEQGRGELRSEARRGGHRVIWFKCSLFISSA